MNICSNQIKEVILHRFKVNSLQKLLIHINILLAFIVLFCSHSAFGQRVYIDDFSADYGADLRAVDLGLNVYWASKNVGATDSIYPGDYFTWNAASNWSDPAWQDWRTPNKDESEELLNSCSSVSYENNGVKFSNNNKSILIPKSSFYDYSIGYHYQSLYRELSYFWTSIGSTKHSNRAFRFQGGIFGIPYLVVSDAASAEARSYLQKSKLPIRPVIDKDTIIVTTAGGNTITKTYPRGTKIKIGAFMDECHKVAYWTKSSISESGTITPNNTSGDNGDIEIIITEDVTYTAYFSIKTTNVKATTEDNRKGTVGILEPINN